MAKPGSDEKSFQLLLPVALHRRLKILAAERGITITALILRALEATYPDLPPRPASDPPEAGRKGGEYQVNPAYGRGMFTDH